MCIHRILSTTERRINVLQYDHAVRGSRVQQMIESYNERSFGSKFKGLPVVVEGPFAEGQHADTVTEMTGEGRDETTFPCAWRTVEEVAATVGNSSISVPENGVFYRFLLGFLTIVKNRQTLGSP